MFIFIIVAILIVIISLAFMLRPLVKKQESTSVDRDTQNFIFAKKRLSELEEQVSNNEISAEDFESLKLEIEQGLIKDTDLTTSPAVDKSDEIAQSNGIAITLLCTLIPFAALIIYQISGEPAALDQNNLTVQQTNFNGQEQNFDQMIAQVEQRMQNNPDDIEGWAILAQSYMAVERYQDALDTNKKLLSLVGESAEVYTQLADSSALLAGGILAGQPIQYVQKALAINPQYPQALWLAGLNAAQNENSQEAISYWNRLLPLLANSPQQQQELQDIIAQTSDVINNPDLIEETGQADNQADLPGITVRVSIDPEVAAQYESTDSVFIFARAQNGPPAPLAVKRLTVANLPVTVSLNDNDAMVAQFKLSLFADIVVAARVSKSGNPIAQSGDFESSEIISKNTNNEIIELNISTVVE